MHLELKAPTELSDRTSGEANMAERKSPSYSERPVGLSVDTLYSVSSIALEIRAVINLCVKEGEEENQYCKLRQHPLREWSDRLREEGFLEDVTGLQEQ